ncbi:MAG: NAD(P)-dependent alcohol dehydrogenase [Saprospiraceae bacterium]|nr:NAD(P)-dependent alcohol dehydrogenase [Saprospiraceae bacterium]
MSIVKAYGTHSPKADLLQMTIERRAILPKDVKVKITYSGICHSDIHTARNDWKGSKYPVVPGHEIVGEVVEVGAEVTRFKVGDTVGVGVLVDSCKDCRSCNKDLEQFCLNGATFTYNSHDPHLGTQTYGGYSETIVVDEHFVLQVPDNLNPAGVAPLLCAGITTYSPLAHWKAEPGKKVGVIGLGGLGHMGIKFSHAMGAETIMITRSPGKGEDAKALGADGVLISTDHEAVKAHMGTFDILLNTIPVAHEMDPYLALLAVDGIMIMVGAIEPLKPFHGGSIIGGRKTIAGSMIGGLKETQEMLDFCGQHNIVSDIELIQMQEVNQAYERVIKGDVKYRFVIDMDSLRNT